MTITACGLANLPHCRVEQRRQRYRRYGACSNSSAPASRAASFSVAASAPWLNTSKILIFDPFCFLRAASLPAPAITQSFELGVTASDDVPDHAGTASGVLQRRLRQVAGADFSAPRARSASLLITGVRQWCTLEPV